MTNKSLEELRVHRDKAYTAAKAAGVAVNAARNAATLFSRVVLNDACIAAKDARNFYAVANNAYNKKLRETSNEK